MSLELMQPYIVSYNPVDNHTIAYFPFTSNLNDGGIHGFNMTSPGVPAFSTVAGKTSVGGFDGGNYLNFATGLNTALTGLTDWTIESQINYSDVSGGYWLGINLSSGFYIIWGTAPTNAACNVQVNGGSAQGNAGAIANDSNWHSVALTQSSGNVYLFVDGIGQLILSGCQPIAAPATSCIGVFSPSYPSTFNFHGNIRQLRFSDMARTNFIPLSL